MRCISVTYNSSWLLAHDGNAILGLLKINYLMPWCLCLTVSYIWFVLYALSKLWSFAAGLNVSVQPAERQLGLGRGHTRYSCVCLLSLQGPRRWYEDFLCFLPVLPSPAPSHNQAPQPKPARPLPFSLSPSLSWALSGMFSDAIKQKGKFLIARTHPLERFQPEKSPLRKVRAVSGGLGARIEENASLGGKIITC